MPPPPAAFKGVTPRSSGDKAPHPVRRVVVNSELRRHCLSSVAASRTYLILFDCVLVMMLLCGCLLFLRACCASAKAAREVWRWARCRRGELRHRSMQRRYQPDPSCCTACFCVFFLLFYSLLVCACLRLLRCFLVLPDSNFKVFGGFQHADFFNFLSPVRWFQT